jgi:hypothetical protein
MIELFSIAAVCIMCYMFGRLDGRRAQNLEGWEMVAKEIQFYKDAADETLRSLEDVSMLRSFYIRNLKAMGLDEQDVKLFGKVVDDEKGRELVELHSIFTYQLENNPAYIEALYNMEKFGGPDEYLN